MHLRRVFENPSGALVLPVAFRNPKEGSESPYLTEEKYCLHVRLFFQSGAVFVFTGLLGSIENADQLGIILAHEMAHAVLGHGVRFAQFEPLFLCSFRLIFVLKIRWSSCRWWDCWIG